MIARIGCVALLLACCACHSVDPKPDVVLVTIDTWRHDANGYSGAGRVETPNIDALAADGVIFERAYAHNVV